MIEEGPRAPKPNEIEDLIAHVNLVMREEVGSAPSFALDWPYVITRENLENIRVVLVDDHIVSSTAIVPHETSIGGVNLRIGGINGVSTHPDYRRRGYASRILEACIDHMRDLGCHLSLLSTGVPSWYRKLGWEYAGKTHVYRFDRGNRGFLASDPGLVMRTAEPSDFGSIAAIHAGRNHGAVRSADHMRTVFTRNRARTWVAEDGGEVRAYVWTRGHAISEYGGPSEFVIPMISRLLDEWDDSAIQTSTRTREDRLTDIIPTVHASLSTPAQPDAVTEVLDAIGILRSSEYVGMMRIENLEGLLQAYGLEDVEVECTGSSIRFTGPGWSHCCSPTDTVKLLFGPERPAGLTVDGLPFTFHEWPADRV